MAGLSNLYRAITIVSDPTTIPNVEPKAERNTWVVPDFDGWAFPNVNLRSYISFRERLQFVEIPFEEKDSRPVWRGAMNNKVRTALMNVGRDQGWADVKEMNSQTRLNMVDFCRYKFPIHTEGNTWSGRLRYLQNCDSVTVIHQPLEHQAHFYDLLIAEGPDQNFLSVRNDFSDLQEKAQYYLSHPEAAARIVNNSVATFRDRYLTPAAEACYWRRLIRAWAEVQAFSPTAYSNARQPDGTAWMKQRGVDWEIFAHPDPTFLSNFPKAPPGFDCARQRQIRGCAGSLGER
ncbi:hypothetical protein SLS57_006864 [Botryosphaeria dothidea]